MIKEAVTIALFSLISFPLIIGAIQWQSKELFEANNKMVFSWKVEQEKFRFKMIGKTIGYMGIFFFNKKNLPIDGFVGDVRFD